MFILNPGRYIVADPEIVLNPSTFKNLWASHLRLESRMLDTCHGRIYALPTHVKGEVKTSLGRSISTQNAFIAFIPYLAAEKLLPYGIIMVNLAKPALLYINQAGNIILDGKFIIFSKSLM